MFHDINNLIFIYHNPTTNSFSNNSLDKQKTISNNITKKVYINTITNKKTKRKYT